MLVSLLASLALAVPLAPPPLVASSAQEAEARMVVLGVPPNVTPFVPEALPEVLRGHFASTDLEPVVRVLPGGDLMRHLEWAEEQVEASAVRAVFWIEPAVDGSNLLYLIDPGTGELWVRGLPQSADPDLVLESTAIMLRATATGLARGHARGMQRVPRPEADASAPPREDPRPAGEGRSDPVVPLEEEDPALRWTVGASYVGSVLAREVPWQSGGGLQVSIVHRTGALVELGAGLLAPALVAEPIRTAVWRLPVPISAGFRFRRGAALQPEAFGGLLIEPVWWRSEAAGPLRRRPGATARVAVAAGGRLRWRWVAGLGAHLGARVDLWALNVDLVSEVDGVRRIGLQPFRVSGSVDAGLHYTF